MSARLRSWLVGFVVGLVGFGTAWSQTCTVPAGLSLPEMIEMICPKFGVPLKLTYAVIQVESEFNPYAINVAEGKGYSIYPSSKANAVDLLARLLPLTEEVGIGLMQIHYSIHADRYKVSAVDLLDPRINLAVGCDVLGKAIRGGGTWIDRIGRYNARSYHKRVAYARRVLTVLEQMK